MFLSLSYSEHQFDVEKIPEETRHQTLSSVLEIIYKSSSIKVEPTKVICNMFSCKSVANNIIYNIYISMIIVLT